MEFLRVCPTVRTSDYWAPFSFNDYRRLFMLKKLCAALCVPDMLGAVCWPHVDVGEEEVGGGGGIR